jgi:GNAT superfamily N-acetyltransferase
MFEVRPATPADAEGLTETVVEGFASYRSFAPEGWAPPDRIELGLGIAVALRQGHQRTWVAVDADGHVTGQVAYVPAAQSRMPADDPDLAHINQVFVRRAWWGTGLARTLLQVAVDDARAAGYTGMRLYTPEGQARARAFYEREGWTLTGPPLEGEPIGLTLVEYRRGLGGSGSRGSG